MSRLNRARLFRLIIGIGAATLLLTACGTDENADGTQGDENAPTIVPTASPVKTGGSDGSMSTNASPIATPTPFKG